MFSFFFFQSFVLLFGDYNIARPRNFPSCWRHAKCHDTSWNRAKQCHTVSKCHQRQRYLGDEDQVVKFEQVPLQIWLIYKPHVQILKLDELCMISDRLKPVNFMSYPESRINLKYLYVEK